MNREITVLQDNASGRLAYWEDADNHSLADRNGVSLADYIHALYGFLRQAKARHVLMIGCGGGSLATMLRRAGVGVTLVDVDAASFEIARRFFHMPASVACHVGDGRAFLRRHDTCYAAIVLDAFRDGKIPQLFLRPAFFRLVKARLKRGGVFLVNIVAEDRGDPLPLDIARQMQAVWRRVALLDTDRRGPRNAVAVAGRVRDLKAPRLLMRPRQRARAIAAALAKRVFYSLRLAPLALDPPRRDNLRRL